MQYFTVEEDSGLNKKNPSKVLRWLLLLHFFFGNVLFLKCSNDLKRKGESKIGNNVVMIFPDRRQ